MIKNGRLICLIGIDGTGKSTHITKLIDMLSKNDINCRHVRCGAHVRFATGIIYIISRFFGLDKNYNCEGRYIHTPQFPEVFKNKVLLLIWPYAVLIDMFILISIRIKFPLLFNSFVFSDRYVHDVLVESMVAMRDFELYKRKPGTFLLNFVKPYKVILLDLDEKDAFDRKNDIPDMDYLTARRNLYREMAKDLSIPIIKTDREFDLVHKDIANACDLALRNR